MRQLLLRFLEANAGACSPLSMGPGFVFLLALSSFLLSPNASFFLLLWLLTALPIIQRTTKNIKEPWKPTRYISSELEM